MKQEMMGWQWHQLDHMQILCTSLETDNHASTSPLNFYSPDALRDAQGTVCEVVHTAKLLCQQTDKQPDPHITLTKLWRT